MRGLSVHVALALLSQLLQSTSLLLPLHSAYFNFFILSILILFHMLCRTFQKQMINDCYELHHFVLPFFSVNILHFCFQATRSNRLASACPSSSSNRRNPASASVPAGTLLKTRVQRVPPPLFQPQHSRNHQSPLLLHHHRSPQILHTIQAPRLLHASLSLPPRWVRWARRPPLPPPPPPPPLPPLPLLLLLPPPQLRLSPG